MDHELDMDVAAGLSAGGFVTHGGKHGLALGTPCYNCATPLRGRWCYACGQLGEDFHRSAIHLIGEVFESFTHADGRLWQTLPHLVLRPAVLTRDYLAGKRAPQIPPLRLFLVVLLMVFVAGEMANGPQHAHKFNIQMDPGDKAQLQGLNIHVYKAWDPWINDWARTHVLRAAEHPDRFVDAMGAWAHDFAFLMLPISALILSALFIFRRRFVLFDHLVFSMHSLSFQGLLFVAMMAVQATTGAKADALLLASPVHLFFHLRGVYGLGNFATLMRMIVLFLCSIVALSLVMLGLVVVGLAALQE
jgi:hypothetical protein